MVPGDGYLATASMSRCALYVTRLPLRNFWKATSASQVGGRRPTARGPGGVVTGSFRVRCLAQTHAVTPNYLDRPDERIPAHAFVTPV